MEPLLLIYLVIVFLVGICVGSFLNVVIARLPLEKSLVWPGSRCGSCFQPIHGYDNIPLISYLILRGRCRTCGASFSARYLIIELLTGLGFVLLFHLEVVNNLHNWPALGLQPWQLKQGQFPPAWIVGFGYHALLFAFLLAASICDLDGREIPLPLTLTGTAVGLIGAVCFPWPWPVNSASALPRLLPGMMADREWQMNKIGEGLYAWPVWDPLPNWLAAGSWQLGLATGLAGALCGTLMLRAIGFLFSKGLGKEALGLGDADVMMMAGAFLGWQMVVVGFFLSVVPALVFGIVQLAVRRDNSLPFAPSLAAGVLLTMLGWGTIGPFVQAFFFWPEMLLAVAGVSAGFMLLSSFALRLLQGRGAAR